MIIKTLPFQIQPQKIVYTGNDKLIICDESRTENILFFIELRNNKLYVTSGSDRIIISPNIESTEPDSVILENAE